MCSISETSCTAVIRLWRGILFSWGADWEWGAILTGCVRGRPPSAWCPAPWFRNTSLLQKEAGNASPGCAIIWQLWVVCEACPLRIGTCEVRSFTGIERSNAPGPCRCPHSLLTTPCAPCARSTAERTGEKDWSRHDLPASVDGWQCTPTMAAR